MLVVGHRANSLRVALFYRWSGVKAVEVDVTGEKGLLVARHGPPSIRRASILGRIFSAIDYRLFYRDPLGRAERLSSWISKLGEMGFEVLVLDVKPDLDPLELIGEVESSGWGGRVVVTGWDHRLLARIKELAGYETLATFTILPVNLVGLVREARADGVSIRLDLALRPGVVESLKKEGLKVAVWTVNDVAQARRVASLGVDAIISDRPDLVFRALNSS